jgi:hypothetical protein
MRGTSDRDRVEVWIGIECTMNRVGDRYHDQLARSGHDHRPDDVERLAALGVRAVRFPVLWERHEADPCEWDRTDDRLARLRARDLRPILGLVHHGSGPPHTSLADPAFADGLANFATRVAERYPWAGAYTPVKRAAHHRPLRRVVRPLVSARARGHHLRPLPVEPVPRCRSGDARCPARQPDRPALPDRRPRPDPRPRRNSRTRRTSRTRGGGSRGICCAGGWTTSTPCVAT